MKKSVLILVAGCMLIGFNVFAKDMIMVSNGNVGIGVSSPTNNLQVSGTSTMFSSDTGNFRTFISKKNESYISSIIFQDNFSGRAQMGLINDDDFHFQVSTDGNTYTDALLINNENGHIGIGDPDTTGARFSIIDKDGGTAFKAASYEGGYSIVARKDGSGGGVFISKVDEGAGKSLHIIHHGIDPAMVIEDSTSELVVVESSGNVGIGTATPKGKLDVNGSIYQRGKVLNADYVFGPDYQLEAIREHADFMWKNKHLKAISKAAVDENGKEIVEIGSHFKGIVEELEKAHIYIEQLHEQMDKQKNRMLLLEERMMKMEARN
jgi:hypothetical protein